MPSQRERIRMSDEEIHDFLRSEPRKLQLATINADGTPHLVTMYYDVFDGRIGFWTYRTSQKAVNLRRDPRCTCLVEAGDDYLTLRGVQIVGAVDTITDLEDVRAMGERIYERYLAPNGDADDAENGGGLDEGMAAYIDAQAKKRHAYLVTPREVVSWDHRKLG